jgi:hypothetical protein
MDIINQQFVYAMLTTNFLFYFGAMMHFMLSTIELFVLV